MPKNPDAIRVEIYDQEYSMRGELDPEYIQKLAQFLDARMRSVAERTRTVDSLRVAVLAALNIADEYHQLKSKYETIAQNVDRKVGECSDALDRVLKEAV
ncbi:MAG TPA: cell division protein ZapA [Terriglobia bacterium]|nr:cell division protein ZapA [Terriglobia bacterium]